jgi:hypothetical protein
LPHSKIHGLHAIDLVSLSTPFMLAAGDVPEAWGFMTVSTVTPSVQH